MGRAFHDLPLGEDGSAIAHAMQHTEIVHISYRNAPALSGDEQARTTFARVMLQSTRLFD